MQTTSISAGNCSQVDPLGHLIEQLSLICGEMAAIEQQFNNDLQSLHSTHHHSARNLLHYLALRRHDLRQLQAELASHGLSSLGRSESQVAANIDAVMKALFCMSKQPFNRYEYDRSEFGAGKRILESNTVALLGPPSQNRTVRIMVTMPTEAATDYGLVRNLLNGGMNCMRINGAHDDEDAWFHMVENLRRAQRELGQPCTVLMDLPSPKHRTGPTELVPGVIRLRPKRDRYGKVTAAAKVCLTPIDKPRPDSIKADAVLTVPGEWLSRLEIDQQIEFLDARRKRRSMKVVNTMAGNCIAETEQSCYLTSETILRTLKNSAVIDCRIGEIPPIAQPIVLRPGDYLYLVPVQDTGASEQQEYLSHAPSIGVTLREIFSDVQAGESIWFDDGKIGGVIRDVNEEQILVEITRARQKGEKLRADKGINLPDSKLTLPALTADDIKLLPFVARHADAVEYSFVRRASDIHLLQTELRKIGGANLGIVLKIETRKAFERLPELILAAMQSPRVGLMIARGDLAVECGFERTGELQEEILWIAEAAHVPVIWATQVLENLAKKGSLRAPRSPTPPWRSGPSVSCSTKAHT
jgi:pyruvate kinase